MFSTEGVRWKTVGGREGKREIWRKLLIHQILKFMPHPHGKEIGFTEANDLVVQSSSIKSRHDGFIQGVLVGAHKPVEAVNFYGSGYNGYIFDRDLVTRFFGDAQYLLVLVGAAPDGIPTVLVAGCVDGDDEDTFKSLNIENPASEHPPKQFTASFPPAAIKSEGQYEIVFKIES